MTKVLWAFTPVLAAVAVWGIAARQDTTRQLQVTGGRSTLIPLSGVIEANHLKLTYTSTADCDQNTSEKSVGFGVSSSDLKFSLKDGALARFEGGKITHGGGFQLAAGKRKIDADQFMLTPSKNVNDALELWVDTDREAYMAFQLVHMRPFYLPKTRQVFFQGADLQLSLAGAQHLGRPELAGMVIGSLNVYGDADPIDGRGDVEIAPVQSRDGGDGGQDSVLNLSISNVDNLTYLARTGTFPNGRNGFTMLTTSCNVGDVNVPWSAPMQVQHPVIAMNLYRLKNGRFEQIGWSWLKHGFFATNSSGCGSCQNPGTGSLLGPGCSDTYGTSNNSDRFYLGGRDEVNPLTGVWTCQNSYFSNYQNDCVRRNNGTGLDGVAHRLEVADADLTDSSAQYFYEAYYINANDTDRYNNAASRQATISWTGSGYSVNTVGGFVQGIALDRWGEMRNFAEPRDEGDVKVAVQTTDLGGGMWRYEYAVYNHTLDRQVRTFSIGVPAGATVQNIGFHDIDQDSGNQWTSSFSNGSLTWSTGAFGSPNANPLKYASLFNFRFECNVPPANSQAVLGMFKPGNGDTKTAYIKGPMTTQHLESFAVINASIGDGDIQSLGESDDNRMNLIPDFRNLRTSPGIEGTLTSPTQSVSSFSVTVESRNTLSTTHQEIWLFNWGTAQWETIDSRPTTLTDSVATVSVSSNPGRFIDASGQVKVRVIHVPPQGQLNSRWSIGIDKIGISFN